MKAFVGILLLVVGIFLLFVGGFNFIVNALPAWFISDHFWVVESIPLIGCGAVLLIWDRRSQHAKPNQASRAQ